MKTQISILALFVAALFTGCQKNDGLTDLTLSQEATIEKSTTIAINDIVVDKAAEESYYEVSFYAESEKLLRQFAHLKGRKTKLVDWHMGLRYQLGVCPDVSIDSTDNGYPITITLNYGDGTELQNGTVISGIIKVELSAPRKTPGATRTVNYIGFAVDTVGIEGVFTEVFVVGDATNRTTNVSSDLTFSLPDGTVINRTAEKTHQWLAGLDTPMDHRDDTIQITGSVEASNQDGESYSKVISTPLIKVGDCPFFISGEVTFSLNGTVISVLNYGDGTCDDLATLTSEGETIEIHLKGGNKPTAERKPKGKK